MKTNYNSVLQETSHICEPDIVEYEVKKQVCAVKKYAREEETLFSKIYEQKMSKLYNRSLDFVSNIPIFTSVRSSLYHSIYTIQGHVRESANSRDIVISDDILKMDDGSSFLILDKNGKNRIWYTSSNLEKNIILIYHKLETWMRLWFHLICQQIIL